jgi:hypothetical protein
MDIIRILTDIEAGNENARCLFERLPRKKKTSLVTTEMMDELEKRENKYSYYLMALYYYDRSKNE